MRERFHFLGATERKPISLAGRRCTYKDIIRPARNYAELLHKLFKEAGHGSMLVAKIAANINANSSLVNFLSNKTLIYKLYLHTSGSIRGSDALPFIPHYSRTTRKIFRHHCCTLLTNICYCCIEKCVISCIVDVKLINDWPFYVFIFNCIL